VDDSTTDYYQGHFGKLYTKILVTLSKITTDHT